MNYYVVQARYNMRPVYSMINVVTYMDLRRFDRTNESGAADHVCFSLQGLKGLDPVIPLFFKAAAGHESGMVIAAYPYL
jgi:hypothetical protein